MFIYIICQYCLHKGAATFQFAMAFHLMRTFSNDRTHQIGTAIFLGSTALMLLAGAFLEDFRLFAVIAFLIAGIHEKAK